MMKFLKCLAIGAGVVTSFGLTPATATAAVTMGGESCSLDDLSITATACTGFFHGNLVSGNGTALADSAAIINELIGTDYNNLTVPIIETLPSISGSAVDFSTPLFGQTVIAVHTGAARGHASGIGYQGTAFYVFDAGNLNGGVDNLTFNRPGLSNARLFITTPGAVPEPSTWATLILGFFGLGFAIRRKKQPLRKWVQCA